jgi:cytosine/adenosine deaminase-related metal-dependent hydrolase
LGSARVLGRDDIGRLVPGKAADVIAVDLNKVSFAGGLHDPVAALVLCDAGRVDLSIVNGRVRVQDGELVDVDLPELIKRQNRLASELVRRTEKRYNISLRESVWRRAYPYDPMSL